MSVFIYLLTIPQVTTSVSDSLIAVPVIGGAHHLDLRCDMTSHNTCLVRRFCTVCFCSPSCFVYIFWNMGERCDDGNVVLLFLEWLPFVFSMADRSYLWVL